ncbi:tRNA uridine-5-carboxymethylaminomethyl(34) synthesis GTPase MnmE [Pontibacter sp. BT310]|uniref:tRNA modification GTPase MnmE n=1 Tax=Pontibacter populi TaxID=890055 RepID=A0ABS6XA62_9BACT|nr:MULTISPECIES: tRNA uridine-5-carboxymethylaminomethyl(34) synthesis GTPase MnmE [Pontibacter]MBJ6117996.1 tRNA uridine-5-carboxymethylaminomethyl(34) synthesis GTPase MnmE [Pontibacter sp. BT310]MBR0570423.1 tRNA uridine-5-carboxymethylaminomethyl(34) synthesis GTPase MnmE [Microvirga sp. STS03]MBW3364849.1 tRNA uridine-5-carboxymethylaminomethyl(34) synthesis GTPase MnmE [Pontibacter populi]
MNSNILTTDTIVAVATAPGTGAIAVIRLSGPEAITITNSVFKGKDLIKQASHTLHFGTIRDGEKIIDEVLVSLFVAPHSYTKENVVEISCHGSDFIVQQIMQLLLKKGARLANAGEFTKRAFLNGQFDLAQAEAVADLIASDSALSHEVAMKQMRGGFSQEIKRLRGELVHFASMIELELDFGEEDVEFADREQLRSLINNIQTIIRELLKSFELGNVIKNGVPTVIVGKPNAGKSTLLNKLLNEEKAIVSDVPGTTRDFIEDEINIGGITFRFIDTAGLRETTDKVEAIGVERTHQKLSQSALIIYLFDITESTPEEVQDEIAKLNPKNLPLLPVANKIDQATPEKLASFAGMDSLVQISAAEGANLEVLKQALTDKVNLRKLNTQQQTIVTNLRHVDSLNKTYEALDDVLNGLAIGISNDLVAADIRRALYSLGQITGEITTDDLLDNIFTKFCIGK